MNVCISIRMYVDACIVYVCIVYVCMYVCMYFYSYVCSGMYCVCMFMHVFCMYFYSFVCLCMNAFMHTHSQRTNIPPSPPQHTGADIEPVSERLYHSQTGKESRKAAL
jgi:uncharacterized membrane protein